MYYISGSIAIKIGSKGSGGPAAELANLRNPARRHRDAEHAHLGLARVGHSVRLAHHQVLLP